MGSVHVKYPDSKVAGSPEDYIMRAHQTNKNKLLHNDSASYQPRRTLAKQGNNM